MFLFPILLGAEKVDADEEQEDGISPSLVTKRQNTFVRLSMDKLKFMDMTN